MNLLDIYKEKNKNFEWFQKHFSLGEGASGNMFEYIGTNSRRLDSFMYQFSRFLEIENKPRGRWPKQENHGQEIHKQYVVNMLQSKLFKKDPEGIYNRTKKGFLYSDFIDLKMGEREKWLVNYLFLLNGYYLNRKNYIIYRVEKDLLGCLLSADGITVDLLIQSIIDLLKLDDDHFSKILRNDFFYIHSFYDDSDFLIKYLRSTVLEKEELAQYIEKNREGDDLKCCLSKKYQQGGNFNQAMLIDEAKVFLLTMLIIKSRAKDSLSAYSVLVESFDENIGNINKKYVLKYFLDNKKIFDPILEDILEIEELEGEIEEGPLLVATDILQQDTPEEYIDETEEIGRQKIKTIYNIRKRQAKVQSNYVCALEKVNNCRYFTAKLSGKNYIELHHLIPREFRNDFSFSIEVLANYTTLCPHCHRQIHLATDRERQHLINALYNERVKRLMVVGLKLELKDIYKYYRIDL